MVVFYYATTNFWRNICMNIYTEKKSDIIYSLNIDFEKTLVNYPLHICQYSSGFLIKINLFKNQIPLKEGDYIDAKIEWFNTNITTKDEIHLSGVSADGHSIYFKMDSKCTSLYTKYYPNFPFIKLITKDGILSKNFEVIFEMNPIQKEDM